MSSAALNLGKLTKLRLRIEVGRWCCDAAEVEQPR